MKRAAIDRIMRMTVKLILIFLLITNVCHASDYSFEEYEEIPDASSSTAETSSTTLISVLTNDDEDDDLRRHENDVLLEKEQLDVMSAAFRKSINKLKMKHKRIEMIFLVDSSSSVGKENFANEISFVKRLLSDFNVSFNHTRVALITFSSRSKIVSILVFISLNYPENISFIKDCSHKSNIGSFIRQRQVCFA